MIRKMLKGAFITLCIIIVLILVLTIFIYFSENGKIVLPIKHEMLLTSEKVQNFPTMLQTYDNKIVDESRNIITLKGVNTIFPGKLHNQNMFNKDFFMNIANIKANVIRIPVNPEGWLADEDYMWRYLDPAISWAGELGMYVIIDLHFIGNIKTGEGEQMPDIDISPSEFVHSFWEQVASHYKNVPNVLFEIYNEPAYIEANEWRPYAKSIVETIRNTGANQIIIVSGVEYSRDLSWVLSYPIKESNIAYACHIYPGHSNSLWSHWFGKVSALYPVIMTEWGFIDEHRDTTNQAFLIGSKESYGIPLLEYLNEKNIGWLAWAYDDKWEPQMFKRNFDEYTNFGEFVIDKIKE